MSADNKYKRVFTQSKTLAAEMVKVTHAELLNMVENEQLTPGAYYRITDYVAVFSDQNNHFTSAGHQFDIITMALSENTLSENCSAMVNDNDNSGYFNDNNLEAWKIKYAITQNELTPRFYNYDQNGGKGYIYNMTDEFGNTAPCDFKNRLLDGYYLFSYEYEEVGQIIIEDFSLNPNCYQNTVISKKYYDALALPESIIIVRGGNARTIHGNKICGNINITAEVIIDNTLTGDIKIGGEYLLAGLERCKLISGDILNIDIETNYYRIVNTNIYTNSMGQSSGLRFTPGGSEVPITENCTFILSGLSSKIDMCNSQMIGQYLQNLTINCTYDFDIYMSVLTRDEYVILKYNPQNSSWIDMSINLQTATP